MEKAYYNVLQKGAIVMAISLRLSDEESILVKGYVNFTIKAKGFTWWWRAN